MEPNTRAIPVSLPNGQTIRVEATALGDDDGLERPNLTVHTFDAVIGAIEGVAGAVQAALEKVRPKKTTVELGLEVGLEAGQLTALLVKGTGKANLKISLTWE
jgi:hypothetical protein